MYCVVQEIETRKKSKGNPKELKTYETTFTIKGETGTTYRYCYSDELFERPISKAYRITIHESRRVNGKVTKKQVYICTVGYYDIVDYGGYILDFMTKERKEKILVSLGMDEEALLDMVYVKFQPIIDRIQAEYAQTEEYRTVEEHRKVINAYQESMDRFAAKYKVDCDEYKHCYDVFGVLRDSEYLDKIKREFKARREYEKKSRSYYENFYDNYTNGSSTYTGGSHSEDDKAILKQFYRELSKKFHPDANPGTDTSEQMKVLNRLKEEWGV